MLYTFVSIILIWWQISTIVFIFYVFQTMTPKKIKDQVLCVLITHHLVLQSRKQRIHCHCSCLRSITSQSEKPFLNVKNFLVESKFDDQRPWSTVWTPSLHSFLPSTPTWICISLAQWESSDFDKGVLYFLVYVLRILQLSLAFYLEHPCYSWFTLCSVFLIHGTQTSL